MYTIKCIIESCRFVVKFAFSKVLWHFKIGDLREGFSILTIQKQTFSDKICTVLNYFEHVYIFKHDITSTSHSSQICIATNVENPVSSFCWFQSIHQSHWKWGHRHSTHGAEYITEIWWDQIPRWAPFSDFLTNAESLCIHKKQWMRLGGKQAQGGIKSKHITWMNSTWPLDLHNCCFSSGLQTITWFIVLTRQEMRAGRQVPLVSLQGLSDWCWEMLTKTSYWFVESSARGVTLVPFYSFWTEMNRKTLDCEWRCIHTSQVSQA